MTECVNSNNQTIVYLIHHFLPKKNASIEMTIEIRDLIF